MMHGDGYRRNCPCCGQSVWHIRDVLGNRELRGPRNITSSNLDRIFDDNGKRFLVIEEKNPNEDIANGQLRLLRNLARLPQVTVWAVQGTPAHLDLFVRNPAMSKWERVIQGGSFADYQRLVDEWYAEGAVRWSA